MKSLILAVYLVCFAMFAPQTPSPKEPSKEVATPQKISLEAQVKILEIQMKESKLANQYNQCRTEMANIPEAFSKFEKEKQDAVDAAVKEKGFKVEDYDLNQDTFELTKKVSKPVEPPPTPKK